jgi:IS30 family transposase
MVRQYLPKGTDLFVYSQEQLDAIAHEVNNRPSQGPWGKTFTGGL